MIITVIGVLVILEEVGIGAEEMLEVEAGANKSRAGASQGV
jgi:hypothetical protein